MKKKNKLLFIATLSTACLLSLASCQGAQGPKGDQGEPGINGTNGTNGTDGINGSSVLTGSGVPASSLGTDGDSYIDTDTFDFYSKKSGAWSKVGNIKGSTGEQGTTGEQGEEGKKGTSLLSGSGVPSSELGNDGDSYIDTTTFDFYSKSNGEWKKYGNFKGADGSKGEEGTKGTDGKQGTSVLTGSGEPASTLGNDGDSYIDTQSFDFYSKADGVWTKVGNIKGEKGDAGEKGDKGNTGWSGSKGDKGDTAWSNTILPSTGTGVGYVTASVGSATKGSDIIFYIIPDDDSYCSSLELWDKNNENTKIESFEVIDGKSAYKTTMVEGGYVVKATFETAVEKTVSFSGTNGTVKVNGNDGSSVNVKQGQKVTVTLEPNDLYDLDTLTVDNQAVTPTKNSDGTYTYVTIMGSSDMTINATFKEYPAKTITDTYGGKISVASTTEGGVKKIKVTADPDNDNIVTSITINGKTYKYDLELDENGTYKNKDADREIIIDYCNTLTVTATYAIVVSTSNYKSVDFKKDNTTYIFSKGEYGVCGTRLNTGDGNGSVVTNDAKNSTFIGEKGANFDNLTIVSHEYTYHKATTKTNSTLTVKNLTAKYNLSIACNDNVVNIENNSVGSFDVFPKYTEAPEINIIKNNIEFNDEVASSNDKLKNTGDNGIFFAPTIDNNGDGANNWSLTVEENTFKSTWKHCINVQGYGDSNYNTTPKSISIKNNNVVSFGTRIEKMYELSQADKDAAFLKMYGDTKYSNEKNPTVNGDIKSLINNVLKNNFSEDAQKGKRFLLDLYDTQIKFDGTN